VLKNMKSLQFFLFFWVNVALPIRNQISHPDTDPATRILDSYPDTNADPKPWDPVRYLLVYELIICPLNAVNIFLGNIIWFLIIWSCNVADKMNERQRRKSSSESSSESVKLVILKGE
jgi:hypothetical protein